MSWFLENVPPQSFVDFTVPKRPDGTELMSCQRAGDYETYVAWLADYLHTVRLPLSPDQVRWLDAAPRSPDDVLFTCSDSHGYAASDLAELRSWFRSGGSHAEYHAEGCRSWLQYTAPEDQEDCPFEELSLEAFERHRRAWEQERAARVDWHHADIPYRALLNWALRQIADPVVRRDEVDWYFRNFSDNASK
jgi:hypothetical protein